MINLIPVAFVNQRRNQYLFTTPTISPTNFDILPTVPEAYLHLIDHCVCQRRTAHARQKQPCIASYLAHKLTGISYRTSQVRYPQIPAQEQTINMPKHTAQPEGQASSESRSRKKARHVPVSSATEKSRSDGYARAGARNSARPVGKRPSSSSTAANSKGASPKARKSSGAWENDEIERLLGAIKSRSPPYDWQAIADHVQTRSAEQCKSKNQKLMLKDGRSSMGKTTEITTGSGAAAKAESATRRSKIANNKAKPKAKGKSSAKASSSSSVPHKARPTRGKKAKPTTTAGPIAKSTGVPKKDRAGGQRRASNSKKDTATKQKTTTSIGRTSTSSASTPRGFTGPTTGRNTATTQPKKGQEQSPISDRKVSSTRRTKEGRALKMKPKPKPTASPEGLDAAAALSAFASFESSPQGSTKTLPKEIATKKRPYVAKKNSGSRGTGPIRPSEAASGKWTEEESVLFDEALELYGLGDWCTISNFVGSRTPIQCKSHNQKLSIKREKELARSRSSKQASKKKKVQVDNVQVDQVSTTTSPSRTVSPSPSPTTAHADAAAVLFSMMRG